MKAVPFKRKLKHLKKKFQRENVDSYNTRKELNLFVADYGAYFDYISDLEVIIRLKDGDSRRFKKLLIRLGKAAKKKNSIVRVFDILNFIRQGYVRNPDDFKNHITDPRNIPFYKAFKVKKHFVHEKVVLAVSEEKAANTRFDLFNQPTVLENVTKELSIEEYKKIF
jgi:hypothetical protein